MCLVGEAGGQRDFDQRFVRCKHSLTRIVDANFADVVAYGASLELSKHASKMRRMNLNCFC